MIKPVIILFFLFANSLFSQNKFDYFDIELEMKGREHFRNVSCDTLYYSKNFDEGTINKTIEALNKSKKFKLKNYNRYLKIDENERKYLSSELEKLKHFEWDDKLFKKSKAVRINDFYKVFNITDNLKSDEEVKMCSIIYTFSKPIYFRNDELCLILYQENHSGKEAFIHFNVYKVSDRHIPIEEYSEIYFIHKY
jgi:hypothetical protein